ncbi:MAG TPA: hypothetical protein VEZ14_05940 [Dehalococcoidia bacterium]|nr:hypothetical protein [Dehalococcoidia bacterium]
MNPLATHWLRVAFWLFLATPAVAMAVVLTGDVSFTLALTVTLYIWAFVSVILALIALGGLFVRLVGWGVRALRR